jgi:uncharacterized tannase-like protein DUF6351
VRDSSILRFSGALVCAAALTWALTAAAGTGPQILVLSNRADLISGGDALVEIRWPAATNAAKVRIALNDVIVTSAFARRPNGRYMGLVTGLRNGGNVLTARGPGSGAQITITNHPIGGPVFSGVQLQPWICATQVAKTVTVTGNAGSTPPDAQVTTKVSGLGSDPVDDQCNATTVYSYYYRKTTAPADCTFGVAGDSACYTPYDPSNMPPDAEIASFTNDRGATVKDLIRVERGAINRAIYTLVSMFDPRDTNAPWAPPRGWNGKLVWLFGASASHSRFQTSPARGLFDGSGAIGLRRGFMIATSSLTDHGTNSNDVLGAETLMMVKELITERYGEIRYTIGDGCSGGSIKQLSIASAYPGLVDGLQPQCTYADALTPFIEIPDCGDLQANYYARNPSGQALTTAQRSAINGHDNEGFCSVWIRSFLPAMDPTRAQNCAFPAEFSLVYNREGNPKGIRCTALDHAASALGTFTDADGIARASTIVDNVGVQYGLKALRDGVISAEEFVRVNEGVGGYDNDLVWHPQRSRARPEALAVHYRAGFVSDGKQLAKVPIIDMRGNQNPVGDIHANWRPYSVRDRLDRDAGGHGNQLIWKFDSATGATAPGAALLRKAFTTMDAWLATIESDRSANPIEVKVRNNRPPAAVDFCIATSGANEADLNATFGIEDAACPVKQQASPRQVAGGPRAENVYKCQLKTLVFSDPDYGGVPFSDDQKARLLAVFPDGVCNWNAPGVGQVPVNPWTTFAAGPGGQPLGPPPASVPIP